MGRRILDGEVVVWTVMASQVGPDLAAEVRPGEEPTVLFVTYWELNESMSEGERLRIADELTSSGLFPPEGVRVLRWDATPDGWGVLIMEAESAESVHRAIGLWRVASPGFFKSTRTAPALPIHQAIGMRQEIEQVLGDGPSPRFERPPAPCQCVRTAARGPTASHIDELGCCVILERDLASTEPR